MRLTLLPASAYRSMPWANGGGSTCELARHPADGAFDWRLSIARIDADGAFSRFPGVQRHLLALDGDLRLHAPTRTLEARARGPAIRFDGNEALASQRRKARTLHALNLMLREGRASGSIEVRAGCDSIVVDPSASVLFVVAMDETSVRIDDHPFELRRFDSVRIDGLRAPLPIPGDTMHRAALALVRVGCV